MIWGYHYFRKHPYGMVYDGMIMGFIFIRQAPAPSYIMFRSKSTLESETAKNVFFLTYSTWVRNLFIDFFLVWSEIFSEVLFQNIIYPPCNSPCNKQISTISSQFLWRARLRKMVQIATVRIWHWKKMRAAEGWYGIDSELVLRIYKIMTIGQCETQNLLNSS